VLQQAVILALLGYAIGFLISQQLYLITAAGAQIPMRMTWQNGALVFVLSLIMCIGSGIGALRTAFKADPAELF
jgi:putative ABC transport system permease protein